MFQWIVELIEKSGYVGVAFGMFMENIFPPIPSELVMIFSGAAASEGVLNIYLVILVGAIGSILGLIPWYYLGKLYGQDRFIKFANKYGRWLTFSGKDVKIAESWFKNHGKKITLFGRAIPAVRTLIAVPAAIMKMDIKTFLLFAFIGSLIYDGLFAFIGYYLGENNKLIMMWLDLGTFIVFGVVIIWYIYRVITFSTKNNHN